MLQLVSGPAMQTQLHMVPARLGGWMITDGHDVVIPFSLAVDSAVVSVTPVLVLLSYWNELVHLHTSQPFYF